MRTGAKPGGSAPLARMWSAVRLPSRLSNENRLPHFTRIWQSGDTSLTEKTDSDYAVGTLWGAFGSERYLLRKHRARMGLTETIQQVRDMTRWAAERFPRFASHSIFIENAANGPEVRSALRREIQGVIPVQADTDKVSRAYAITPQLEAGNVYVPGDWMDSGSGRVPNTGRTPAWVQELIAECASFPNAAHDDQVDSLTQALDPRRFQRSGNATSGRGGTITGGWGAGDI